MTRNDTLMTTRASARESRTEKVSGEVVGVNGAKAETVNDEEMTEDGGQRYSISQAARHLTATLGIDVKANTIAARWLPEKILPAYEGRQCPSIRVIVGHNKHDDPIYKLTEFGLKAIEGYVIAYNEGERELAIWRQSIATRYPMLPKEAKRQESATEANRVAAEVVDYAPPPIPGTALERRQALLPGMVDQGMQALSTLTHLMQTVAIEQSGLSEIERQEAFQRGFTQTVLLRTEELKGRMAANELVNRQQERLESP